MKIHRGYSRRGLSALIAAGLALGSASAYAETITEDNHTVTVTDERTHVDGARILVHEARDGSADYHANTNTVNITAQGVQTGDLYGAFIEQRAALTGSNFTAEAKGNRIKNQGGAITHATAAWVTLTASDATSLSVTVDDNDVSGTGGAYSYVFGGGFGSIAANSGAVKTIVTNNDIMIENGTLKGGFSAQGGFARAETKHGAAEAHADKNTVTLRNSSSTNGGYSGGTAYALPSGARATATANENIVTITGGAYSDGGNVTGGSATVQNGADTILATANANRSRTLHLGVDNRWLCHGADKRRGSDSNDKRQYCHAGGGQFCKNGDRRGRYHRNEYLWWLCQCEIKKWCSRHRRE